MTQPEKVSHFPLERYSSDTQHLLRELELRGLDKSYFDNHESGWGINLEGTVLHAKKIIKDDMLFYEMYYQDILLCETHVKKTSTGSYGTSCGYIRSFAHAEWGIPNSIILNQLGSYKPPATFHFLVGKSVPESFQWSHLSYLGITSEQLFLDEAANLYFLTLPTQDFSYSIRESEQCIWHELYYKRAKVAVTNTYEGNHHAKGQVIFVTYLDEIAVSLRDSTILTSSPKQIYKLPDGWKVSGTIEGCYAEISQDRISGFRFLPPGRGMGYLNQAAENLARSSGYQGLTSENINLLIHAMEKNPSIKELNFVLIEVPLVLFKKLTNYLKTRPDFKILSIHSFYVTENDYQQICAIRDNLKEKFAISLSSEKILQRKKPVAQDGWRYLKKVHEKWPTLFQPGLNQHWKLFDELENFRNDVMQVNF